MGVLHNKFLTVKSEIVRINYRAVCWGSPSQRPDLHVTHGEGSGAVPPDEHHGAEVGDLRRVFKDQF